ncbi:MAG: hypothetical protein P1V97_31260 [Planctomycetota bacterium]|nr:hypothetical protein [Planctomycetota bacterium]
MPKRSPRPLKKDLFFLCQSCGEFVPGTQPFQNGHCQSCHHEQLRAMTISFRNRFAAGFGLALGMNIALAISAAKHPGAYSKNFLLCALPTIWPLSIVTVFAIARVLDRIFATPKKKQAV